MKNIYRIVGAGVASCAALLAALFSIISAFVIKDSSSVIFAVVITLAALTLIPFTLLKELGLLKKIMDKIYMLVLIPLFAIVVIVSLAEKYIAAVLEAVTGAATSGISYEVLGFVLGVLFIVALIFAVKNRSKWAVITTIAYTGLMTYNSFDTLFATSALSSLEPKSIDAIILLSYATLALNAGLLTFFITYVFKDQPKCESESACEAPKAEENVEEVVEETPVAAEEAAVEETSVVAEEVVVEEAPVVAEEVVETPVYTESQTIDEIQEEVALQEADANSNANEMSYEEFRVRLAAQSENNDN